MRQLRVAAVQFPCAGAGLPGPTEGTTAENIARAERGVRAAASAGAQIVCLQELFTGPYFCAQQSSGWLGAATDADEAAAVVAMRALAGELGVAIVVSFYELKGQMRYNSAVVVDADGSLCGPPYRKSHIPDGPGYQEKFYFAPGDTGFRVFRTRFCTVGVGVCWDQWFPETARAMALLGAEVLLYPTAIGSEPPDPAYDSSAHWRRVMQGHAGANLLPVVASNRVGTEAWPALPGRAATTLTFYGTSFIAGPDGAVEAECPRDEAGVCTATFDLDAIAALRAGWGLFRDRRPTLYSPLLTLDGCTRAPPHTQ